MRTQKQFIEEFRKAIIELDDKNYHFLIENPIKGDIYFDGIEIENFLLEREKEIRETVRGLVKEGVILDVVGYEDKRTGWNTALNDLLEKLNGEEQKLRE